MYRVVEALNARLRAAGVEILTGAQVQSLELDKARVKILETVIGQRKITIAPETIVWTSGLPGIASLLGIGISGYRFDPPKKTVVVNLLLSKPPNMGDLYYLYCYEPDCKTFRITNFTAYCEGAPRAGGWPVAVELLMGTPLLDVDRTTLLAVSELKRFNVLQSEHDVIFSAAEQLAAGFPMPTINNFNVLSEIRGRIAAAKVSNLTVLGTLSEENVFFQRDVLMQTWRKVMEKESGIG
jgi:hypothetical protein